MPWHRLGDEGGMADMRNNYWDAQSIARRRLSRRTFLGAAGATTAGLALAACGGGKGPTTEGTARPGTSTTSNTAGTSKRGGRLMSAAASFPLHFDQHQLPGIGGDGNVYNQMLKLGTQQKILNDLAETWETPDPTTYIFHLRRGVKFQNLPPVNGRDLTAEDVAYTIERSRTDDPAFTNRWMWTELVSLEALDAHTVKATFNRPFAPALFHFAAGSMGVIAREVVEQFGDLKGPESRIGTGPFILDEARRDDVIIYRRNPDYFDPRAPYLDSMEFPVMPDRAARLVAFRSGQVDMLPWQSGIADINEPSRGLDDVNVLLRPSDAPTVLAFNHALPSLSDERVRRAIGLALDQQDLIRAAGGEEAGIVAGMTHPHGEPFALPIDELMELMRPDPTEAKRLLSAAGYGDGLDLSMTVRSTDATDLDVSAVMQQQLAEVNINLKLDTQETGNFVRKLFDKNFESIFVFSWTPALDPGQQFHGSLRSDSAQNWWNANVPEIDALDDQQVQELDVDKRAALIRDLERMNFEKAVTVPLYAINGWIALRDYVKDYDHLRATNALGWQDSEVWLDK